MHAAMGGWTPKSLQCPAWANSASDAPTQQPLQLPPPARNVVKVCNHRPENIIYLFIIFSLLLPTLSLSPAPSRTGRLLPHSQHGISEVRTRPSPLPRRGGTLFSSMLWDLRIIWRLSGRDGRSCCWPHGWYTQPYFQFAQEAACPQPVAQFATFICR